MQGLPADIKVWCQEKILDTTVFFVYDAIGVSRIGGQYGKNSSTKSVV